MSAELLEQRIAQLEADFVAARFTFDECLDTVWMLVTTMLIFFMHAGFSLIEVGFVRFKSSHYILAKNLVVVALSFICWFALGYPLAYGEGDSEPSVFAGGEGGFAMSGLYSRKELLRHWLWQGACCATSATIASGAMAERTKVKGFVAYAVVMSSVIYPIVAHWAWSRTGIFKYEEGGAWRSLAGPVVVDFAGSGMVHLVGGVSALVGAVVVGPRWERWVPSKEQQFQAHNVEFCVLGTFFMWFGWYGFNAGSVRSMHDVASAHLAGIVAVNTTLSPCAAGLLVYLLRAKVVAPMRLDIVGLCNGILAGLASITAPCGFISPWEAILIGLVGGFIFQGASMLMQRLRIDDVVDAFAIHGACGLWGLLAAGLFGDPALGLGGNGAVYGGDQLRTQVLASIAIISWSAGLSLAILVPLRRGGFLRSSDVFQDVGADKMEHSPVQAYREKAAEKVDGAAGTPA
mmetsp:Transcript_4684/g.13559  ORF Transcript_4684/g.13559 Transcript_4684/m.13559 type:complete len:461 (+) Transcript_4684:52-1434(+)